MAFKILTENSVDNTNIDGARAEHFNAGLRDGIVKGAFNEGTFTALASNVISLDTCELRISGHRVINDEIWTQTFGSSPSVATRYALVGQIVVDSSSNVDFSLFVQNAATALVKNNLFRTENGAGTYQVEIGRFTLTTLGTITDVVQTLDTITGGSSGMGEHFIAGDITTTMLESGMQANVTAEDVYDANGDYKQTDFSFELPETAGTVITVNDVEQENLSFTSDPQAQLNNKVDKVEGKGLSENDYTTEEKTKLAEIEAEANKTIVDSALSSSSENPVQNKVVKNALNTKADANNVYTKTETDNLLKHEKIYGTTVSTAGTYSLDTGKKFSDWKKFIVIMELTNPNIETVTMAIPQEVLVYSTSRRFHYGDYDGTRNRYANFSYTSDTSFTILSINDMRITEIWGYK